MPSGDGGYKAGGAASTCPGNSTDFTSWKVLPAMPAAAQVYIDNGAGQPLGYKGPSNMGAGSTVNPPPPPIFSSLKTTVAQTFVCYRIILILGCCTCSCRDKYKHRNIMSHLFRKRQHNSKKFRSHSRSKRKGRGRRCYSRCYCCYRGCHGRHLVNNYLVGKVRGGLWYVLYDMACFVEVWFLWL